MANCEVHVTLGSLFPSEDFVPYSLRHSIDLHATLNLNELERYCQLLGVLGVPGVPMVPGCFGVDGK